VNGVRTDHVHRTYALSVFILIGVQPVVHATSVPGAVSEDGLWRDLPADGTPNNGAQKVSLPNLKTKAARIMVEAADNVFFDVSDANLVISK